MRRTPVTIEICGPPEDEQSRIVRDLMKYISELTENVLVGALAIALSILNMDWTRHDNDEDVVYVSCYQLFAYTYALASACCDAEQATLVSNKAFSIAVKLYGKERAVSAQHEAWNAYNTAMRQLSEKQRVFRNLQ